MAGPRRRARRRPTVRATSALTWPGWNSGDELFETHADQGRRDLSGAGRRQRLARLRSRAVLPRDDRPVRLSARADLQLQRRVQRKLQTAAGAGVHAATRGPRPLRPPARDPQRQHAHRCLHRRAADRLHVDPDGQSRRPRSGRICRTISGPSTGSSGAGRAAAAC